jgi:hypothetical protein
MWMGDWLIAPTHFALGADNRFYLAWGHGMAHTTGVWQYYIAAAGRTGAWQRQARHGGNRVLIGGLSMTPTRLPGCAVCYNFNSDTAPSGFFCDSTLLEPDSYASRGVIREDALGRLQIVYAMDVLKHAYNTGLWHIDTLPAEINVSDWDFAVDSLGRPLIAFVSPDGVFLARGDEVGIEAPQLPVAASEPRISTVSRGVLRLPEAVSGRRSAVSDLLDASGRKVLALHPGANDVSRLSPGVYFVREAECGQRLAAGARKVVLAR